ncbi:MAG: glycosyltransferase family 4 protein [Candidatus Methanomethylicia archaeon]
MKILVFLWHLVRNQVLTSGGLKRFVKLVSIGEKYSVKFTVIENYPSLKLHTKSSNYEPIEFSIPLGKYEDLSIIRFILWIFYMIKATVYGVKITSRQDFDIVMTPSGELFCTAVPAFVVHVFRRIPLVYVVQLTPSGLPYKGILSEYKRYRDQGFGFFMSLCISVYVHITCNMLIKLYNRAQLIIAVSKSLKKQLENYGVRQKIYVVGNGIDVREDVVYVGPKIYDALFVGRHTPQKGVLHVIETWKEVVKEKPNAVLTLIGYCTLDIRKLIENRIRQYNLEKNIILRGVISQDNLILAMKKSKILLFPSIEEAFPMVVGEALAYGLPVICYDIPPIHEIYRTEAVLTCPIGDVNCLVRKLLELISNEGLREELSIKARVYAQRFSWEECVKQEFYLYSMMLRKNKAFKLTN